MTKIEIDPQNLDAAVARFPAGELVLMVNLLRFNARADYSGTILAADPSLEAVSGQQAYLTRYLPAFNMVMAPHGTSELVFAGAVAAHLVGGARTAWDVVAIATYPTIEAFRDLVTDPAYTQTAAPHRLAALADWQLFATMAMNG